MTERLKNRRSKIISLNINAKRSRLRSNGSGRHVNLQMRKNEKFRDSERCRKKRRIARRRWMK